MTTDPMHKHSAAGEGGVSPATLWVLERLDNIAHVIVAAFFILMSATVLVYSGLILLRQFPSIAHAFSGREPEAATQIQTEGTNPFFHNSIEMLSSLLFAVIILELLRTIITYLQTRDIQAIMREFIVVGIISSVRKILLIGAESSLAGASGIEYIREATGTVISIIGILLLIVGLVVLQRTYAGKAESE